MSPMATIPPATPPAIAPARVDVSSGVEALLAGGVAVMFGVAVVVSEVESSKL